MTVPGRQVLPTLQHANTKSARQNHSLGSAHSSGLPIYSEHRLNTHFPSRSLDNVEDHASHSGDERQNCHHEHFPKVKELDARCSTFNNTGRDQHNQRNYYITFVCDNRFFSHETLDLNDPGINEYVDSYDCQAMTIKSTTTFVTTNASIAAPYFGVPYCHSETLAVKIPSVRYTFFSD